MDLIALGGKRYGAGIADATTGEGMKKWNWLCLAVVVLVMGGCLYTSWNKPRVSKAELIKQLNEFKKNGPPTRDTCIGPERKSYIAFHDRFGFPDESATLPSPNGYYRIYFCTDGAVRFRETGDMEDSGDCIIIHEIEEYKP